MNHHIPAGPEAETPGEGVLAGRRILLLEDEMMVAMLVQDMLEDAGSILTPANTIPKALALVETERFDAAILDVNLAGKQSYPVADALAARGIPFVFSTGYSHAGLDPAYRDIGVLAKPYRSETLLDVMTALLSPAA